MRAQRPQALCSFTITLPHGRLTETFSENLASRDAGERQAITGGTSAYAGAGRAAGRWRGPQDAVRGRARLTQGCPSTRSQPRTGLGCSDAPQPRDAAWCLALVDV